MDILFYALGGLVVIAIVLCDALNRDAPTPPDCDHLTSNDERCKAVKQRQDSARARMKALGIRSLLDGRPAWRKIVEMTQHETQSKVVALKRRSR